MRRIRLKKTNQRKAWGCPRTKNRSNWCHAWCAPKKGVGDCGRLAPHAILGRTQQAILLHKIAKETATGPGADGARAARKTRTLSRRAQRRVRVLGLLETQDLEGLRAMAREEATVQSTLVACLSELDDVVRWRTIEALGWVAADIAGHDLDRTRDMVRRLLWSMTEECGGTAWHAPEAIGEILARVPVLADDFTSVLAHHADTDPFQVGVIWSLRRLARIRPDLVKEEEKVLRSAAESTLHAKRGHAAAALRLLQLPQTDAVSRRLGFDQAELFDYDRGAGVMQKVTVGDLARAPLEELSGQRLFAQRDR